MQFIAFHVREADTSFADIKIIMYVKIGGIKVREDKLSAQSMDFAVMIIQLVKQLKSAHESIISNQIGRSGTSIGANIREARYAHGKADFISKLQIALKEANETGYWIELLYRTDYISEDRYKTLDSACTSIRVLLISSINTAKQNERLCRRNRTIPKHLTHKITPSAVFSAKGAYHFIYPLFPCSLQAACRCLRA